MPFTIATWNVNSLRIRLPHVMRWLQTHQPDVLCLQETKVDDDNFPLDPFAELGYLVARHGQKSYNGVAIVSRHPITEVVHGFNGDIFNDHARVITGTVAGIRLTSAYVPNGESVKSPKFVFKEEFYQHLTAWRRREIAANPKLVVCGDFNISSDERDVDDPVRRAKECMFTPVERQWLTTFAADGVGQGAALHDALRLINQEPGIFSWWDYRELGFVKNRGMRIDYLFVSDALKPNVTAVQHHREERKQTQPSDHIPVLLTLAD